MKRVLLTWLVSNDIVEVVLVSKASAHNKTADSDSDDKSFCVRTEESSAGVFGDFLELMSASNRARRQYHDASCIKWLWSGSDLETHTRMSAATGV